MKKLILVLSISLMTTMSTTVVMADPGPYDATMNVDGYDAAQGDGADAILTPNQVSAAPETPQVWEAINQVFTNAALPGLATYANNATTDPRQVTGTNAYWHQISSAGESGNFAVISITAANKNTLGVFDGAFPGSIQYVVPPQTGFTFLGDGSFGSPYPGGINPFPFSNFGFALKSDDGANPPLVWSSDPAHNSDGIDHMLAYYLPELGGKKAWILIDTNADDIGDTKVEISFSTDTYLLAWEDLPLGHQFFDSDYNDTIFLVTRVAPIPEPMSLALLGSGLAAMAGLRRKKAII